MFIFLAYINFFQLKTMGVALIMCPNVGIDPPDDLKLQSCARLECWVGMYLLMTVIITIITYIV